MSLALELNSHNGDLHAIIDKSATKSDVSTEIIPQDRYHVGAMKMSRADLDRTDLKLIAYLERNARASTTTIAREIGLPRTTVRERITRLEQNGTIAGYTLMLTRNPFEEYVRGVLHLDVDKVSLNRTVNFIKKFQEIKSCEVMTGECDLLCVCEAPQLEDLDALTSEISAGDGIRSVRLSVVMSTRFDRRSHASTTSATLATVGISSGEVG